ncbi:MAG: pentapeptide repeat-containing protein [Proteobacteria bacterium]|nr:pentapeptide repeat-containing protein [Pseudomonadota bacterium]
MDLLELLTSGRVTEFNDQRGSRRKIDLFAADLPGLDLTGVDLEGVNLEKSDLTGTKLDDAGLLRANLSGIDGGEMSLAGALGPRVKLRDAWLEDADLSDADFTKGDLKEATLVRTKGSGFCGANARFVGADIQDAAWSGCFLTEASLAGADFTGADVSRSDLTDASASETKFVNTRLDAVLATRLKAPGADFSGASLVGARLDGANLATANLTNANLTGADLQNCNLTGATLTGATLRGANLSNATLDEVDLTELDLTDVDLTGVDPATITLTDAQKGQVSAMGVSAHADAPRRYEDPVGARIGKLTCLFWVNVDGEEMELPEGMEGVDAADIPKTPKSLRWTLLTDRKKVTSGVLALQADGVLGQAVLTREDGFDLWAVVARPDGVQAFRYPLSKDGTVGKRESWPLGYPPAVPPILRNEGNTVSIYGLAARGPTAITHRMTAEGLQAVGSSRMPTATGMIGNHDPIVSNKGGVLTPLGPRRAENPLRAPEGFPGRRATAARRGDETMVVWAAAPIPERDPGGIRYSWLVRRGNPEVDRLSVKPGVVSIDAIGHGESILVAWVEIAFLQGEKLCIAALPDGDVKEVDLGEEAPEKVRFAVSADGSPIVIVTTPEQAVLVVDAAKAKLLSSDRE